MAKTLPWFISVADSSVNTAEERTRTRIFVMYQAQNTGEPKNVRTLFTEKLRYNR